jgi:hypothetical protein
MVHWQVFSGIRYNGGMDTVEDNTTAYDKIMQIDRPGTPLETSGSWTVLIKNMGFKNEAELFSYIEKDVAYSEFPAGEGDTAIEIGLPATKQ